MLPNVPTLLSTGSYVFMICSLQTTGRSNVRKYFSCRVDSPTKIKLDTYRTNRSSLCNPFQYWIYSYLHYVRDGEGSGHQVMVMIMDRCQVSGAATLGTKVWVPPRLLPRLVWELKQINVTVIYGIVHLMIAHFYIRRKLDIIRCN